MKEQINLAHPTKAVIYARVSSATQSKKGDGLASQESRCREYAQYRGYKVVEVFQETLTGSVANRPAMKALLEYLRENKKDGRVVIIDNINRFARDVVAHWHLRDALKNAGGILECPTVEFKDNSHSRYVETILAGGAQYQREINAEQTRDRMRGRLMNGYWPFAACYGYRHEVVSGHKGKLLVRDEPVASIVQEALEGFASRRFESQAEVKRFLEGQPGFPKVNGSVPFQYVTDILKNPIYGGYVELPVWGIPMRKGQHEPLIDAATFERVQTRLKEKPKAPYRADISNDFPLRGAVCCAECGGALTACWSTSRTGAKHAYYLCYGNKSCSRYRKSIRRETIEAAFVGELQKLTTGPKVMEIAKAMFKDVWAQRFEQAANLALSCKREAAKVQKQIDSLLDRLVDASSQTVIRAYEGRIAALERQKITLKTKAEKPARPERAFDELFELAMDFLASPLKLWEFGDLACRRLVLRMAFADRLAFCPENGFRTPEPALPFKLLGRVREGDSKMARPTGFEPVSPP